MRSLNLSASSFCSRNCFISALTVFFLLNVMAELSVAFSWAALSFSYSSLSSKDLYIASKQMSERLVRRIPADLLDEFRELFWALRCDCLDVTLLPCIEKGPMLRSTQESTWKTRKFLALMRIFSFSRASLYFAQDTTLLLSRYSDP